MKNITLAILLTLGLAASAEAWPDKWDAVDTIGEAVTIGLIVVDWGQTSWATQYHRKIEPSRHVCYAETNPILGRYPSKGRVNTYFALAIVGHAAIAYALPKKIEFLGVKIPARQVWQAVWIGIEANQVYRNYQIGVGFRF